MLAEGTVGFEHEVQRVIQAGGERVLKRGRRLLRVSWRHQLVRDRSYRCVRATVFFRNTVLHLE